MHPLFPRTRGQVNISVYFYGMIKKEIGNSKVVRTKKKEQK